MLKFSSKAKTLEELSRVINNATVLPILIFKYSEIENVIPVEKIQNSFNSELLIIRSSAKNEDNFETSNAGKFTSILNIKRSDKIGINNAVLEVLSSFEDNNPDNEIFIQPMLENISMSGVIVTADLDTLSPYYIINYETTGLSDGVTSGHGDNLKTFIQYKNSPVKSKNENINKLINACKECENLFNNSNLDIEFAFNTNDDLYIFQVRPITTKNKNLFNDIDLSESLEKIYKKIKKLSAPHPNLLGNKTIFGVMPDWNPAEIIGIKPKTLSISLYKELITDNIWAYQRDNYGYRNLRSYPLLISFLGVPFIDSRLSFNSFIPEKLNEKISEKLANYYLDKLANTPHLHDKVEFEIVHSCYYLNLTERLKELSNFGFNENEIKRIEFSLLELTNNIINPTKGLYKSDLKKVELLNEKYHKIINSNLSIVDKIYWLIEDCKRFGTLPFAGVARAAFIAVQFLKSFVDLNIINSQEYDIFMKSINTISKTLNEDLIRLKNKEISKELFLSKYGHLRPGTYDILSPSYDENFDSYFSFETINTKNQEIHFEFNKEQLEKIESLIIENGININANLLIKFIKESIEGREYTKFVFTRSLSKILKLIEEFGNRFGITRHDLAYLNIKEIINMYSILDHRDVKEIFETDIRKNKLFYRYTQAIKLPSIIINPEDIYLFHIDTEEPNFITLKRIESEIILEKDLKTFSPKNKIVFIKSADPGYDFLFTKDISGLVTQYGGANSHMSIRCAELGIPAIIGTGEKNFSNWSKAKILEIDCTNKHVRIIS